MYKEIIEHEQEIFKDWLSNLWEENLKNRRLNSIPFIESYIESACNVRNYIKYKSLSIIYYLCIGKIIIITSCVLVFE